MSSSEAHNVLSLRDLPVIMDLNSEPMAITITRQTPPISDTNLVLNEHQMMAYTIVMNHLRDHLTKKPSPETTYRPWTRWNWEVCAVECNLKDIQ